MPPDQQNLIAMTLIEILLSDSFLLKVIGFAVVQLLAFIVFVVRIWVRLSELNAKVEEWSVNMSARLGEIRNTFDRDMVELKTDIEDHKLAYESRLRQLDDTIAKRHERFCDDNQENHDALQKDISFIRETLTEVRVSIGHLQGMLGGDDDLGKKPIRRKR